MLMYTWPSFSAQRLALFVFIALLFVAVVYADNALDNLQSTTPPAASSLPAPVQGHQVWNYTTGNWIASSPAVENGMVYIGSEDGHVYAINANLGTVAWNDQIGNYVSSSPKISGSIVYIGSGDGNIYALDTGTVALYGNIQPGPAFPRPPLSPAGRSMPEAKTGRSLRSMLHPGACAGITRPGVTFTPLLRLPGEWCISAVTTTTCMPLMQQREAWPGTIPRATRSCLHPPWQTVSFISAAYDHNVYALNAGSGAVVWKFGTGGTIRSSPTVSGGVVYIGSDDGNVYALDANTGAARWACKTGGEVDSRPLVDNGTVYAGSSDGNLYALNAANGQTLWYYPTGNSGESSPAIAGGSFISAVTTTTSTRSPTSRPLRISAWTP